VADTARQRTQWLVQTLRAGGATDVRASDDPEWVVCRARSGCMVQVLWLESLRLYYVSRWRDIGGGSELLGEFADRTAAVACALTG
jgi:hypothetical protein